MKRIFFLFLITSAAFVTGCEDTLYEMYNDFTGPVESVALPKTASIEVHTSERLRADVYPLMTKNKRVTWASADDSIASVDADGVVTGNIVDKSTTITATTEEGGFTAQCIITVVPKPVPITELTLPVSLSIATGQQRKLSYSYTPADATHATASEMSWSSSNPSVAAVDGDGIVTGVANGTATITISSAHWGKSATCEVTVGDPTYTVTYNMNDGSGTLTTDSNVYKTGANFTAYAASTFTRQNYNFSGWNTSANGTGTPYTAGGAYTMGNSDIVLYAQWTAVVVDPTYTVSYNKNDGSGTITVDSTSYKTGENFNVSAGAIFTREHYTFSGWKTKADGTGTPYTEGASYPMGTSDIVLYAQWTLATYSVTYVCTDKTGGTVPSVQSYHYGDNVIVQSFSSTTGRLIKKISGDAVYYCSWMDSSTERSEGSSFIMPGNDVILTVKWNKYTAKYNAVPLQGPAGGYVVYDSESYGTKGWRYLELAPASTETEAAWGSSGTDFANGTTTPATLGKGPENTAYLVTKSSLAALYCNNLSVAGYADWFLPSIDELTQMLITNYTWNKAEIGLVADARYWSSSSDTDDYNHAQDYILYSSGSTFPPYIAQDLRSWPLRVRAARRF